MYSFLLLVADDLPLNVSRETLQSSKFLRQVRQIILKRIIQLFGKLAEDDPEKFEQLQKVYGTVIKLGAVESPMNRDKLASLARFNTNQRNMTSLDQVCLYLPYHDTHSHGFSTSRTESKAKSKYFTLPMWERAPSS